MKLKLQLVRDGEVVWEIPLSPTDWPKERLENELEALEDNFQGFSSIFAALSNDTRLKMMKRLMEEDLVMGYAIQTRISRVYFQRYIDAMRMLQGIVQTIPLQPEQPLA